MPDIRQLRYFVTLAETLHFGRAAERLNVTQPPLSRQLAALEHELGVRLLERNSRQVSLTRAGEGFLADTHGVLAALDRACANARLADAGELGQLTIGFMMHAAYGPVPALTRRFLAGFPQVQLHLREVLPALLAGGVLDGSFDAGIGFSPGPVRGLEALPLHREPLCLALPAGHALCADGPATPAMLLDQPLIAAPAEVVPTLRRAIGASALGNAVEWFDYGIYAYGVTYISAALFPGEASEAVLFALATFAISFLVRPLGGLFWGPLGDRIGRKSVLAMTILMMAGATFAVGLIPSYDSIGFWAPAILVLLRMVQGFSTGGEYGGAATFMAEYAPDARRGFYGSFLEFGTLAGFSFGAALMLGYSLHLGDAAMHEWGWRIPFLVAGPIGLIGMYVRSKMEDTPVFLEAQQAAELGEGHERISFREGESRWCAPAAARDAPKKAGNPCFFARCPRYAAGCHRGG